MAVRVCMVVNNLDVGGLEKVVLSLARHLPAAEVELSLVCLSGPGKLFGDLPLPPGACLVLDKRAEVNAAERLRTPLLLARIARFLRARRVEVVHTHNLAPLLYGGLAARLLGPWRPAVAYSEHNQVYRAGGRALRRFGRYLRLADEVVAVSHDLRKTLVEKLQVARTVRVLHNGIDPGAFVGADAEAVERELGRREGEFLVGTAVVLSEQKGIRYLLEAARLVREADPSIRFVVAGDGPLRGELEAQARDMGLGDGVRFLGYRRDVPQLIAALDAYVLPSLWEGLPLALLEALAGGKPILATTVGGNPEVVTDRENGLLFPPRDPGAIARAVLEIRRDPALRRRMREANVEKFRRSFSVASMAGAHVELYRELAARGSPGTRPRPGAP
ncbi:MAG: glycosyltransferase family 4 protein [Deltaproteobacteria bacterium]|nr:glycosyltransferase family 4 protein [Deltaproteobacteria bacterium]